MAIKKFIGRDCELSTTGTDDEGGALDSWTVARAVLRQLERAAQDSQTTVCSPSSNWRTSSATYYGSAYDQDCCRHWLSSGNCLYIDMSHLECATASSLQPRTFAAQSIAILLLAEKARQLAEADALVGTCYDLSASNADIADPGISFGSHISLSVSKPLWENLFLDQRYPAVLGFVASAIAAAIPFFGSGYLLPFDNGNIVYSLSARAHHITRLHTLSTTDRWRRGLLNSRREAHTDADERLHLIGFDYSIISSTLLASLLQCALAAAEEGFCRLNLIAPVEAMRQWSWNLEVSTGKMPATAAMVDGSQVTLPQFMRNLAQTLLEMCEGGLIDETVAPQAQLLLPRIVELTHYAEEGSLIRCANHLDWAAKLMCLLNMGDRFDDPAMRIADHDFSNTNPKKGTIWQLWERQLVDPLIDMNEALDAMREAPPESRDWGRGRIIAQFPDEVAAVDWSFIELHRNASSFGSRLRVEFPRLDSYNRAAFEPIMRSVRNIEELRNALRQQERMVSFYDDSHADEVPPSPSMNGPFKTKTIRPS